MLSITVAIGVYNQLPQFEFEMIDKNSTKEPRSSLINISNHFRTLEVIKSKILSKI